MCHRHRCHAVCNIINVFVAGQLRKAPPKKPEGEIKPYSLMEREGEYNIKQAYAVQCDSFIIYRLHLFIPLQYMLHLAQVHAGFNRSFVFG